jgi:hypothetical protein
MIGTDKMVERMEEKAGGSRNLRTRPDVRLLVTNSPADKLAVGFDAKRLYRLEITTDRCPKASIFPDPASTTSFCSLIFDQDRRLLVAAFACVINPSPPSDPRRPPSDTQMRCKHHSCICRRRYRRMVC